MLNGEVVFRFYQLVGGWGGLMWRLLILGENVGTGSIHMKCQDRFIGLERGVWVSVHQWGLGEGLIWTNEAEKVGVGHVNQYCKHKPLYHGSSGMN